MFDRKIGLVLVPGVIWLVPTICILASARSQKPKGKRLEPFLLVLDMLRGLVQQYEHRSEVLL